MLRLIPLNGRFTVKLPNAQQYNQILALARAFLAQEENRPADEQSPCVPRIRALLDSAEPAVSSVVTHDVQRTDSSEELKRIDKLASRYYRRIKKGVLAVYDETPEKAEQWGFDIWQTGRRKGRIKPIKGRAAYLTFFEQYVTKEESRPEQERFVSFRN